MDVLKTIVHKREPSENQINMKLSNSFTMEYMYQSHIPLQNLSSQAIHAEIFPNLHSSLILIRQLCDYECIFTFYKHKAIVSKNKDKIIEVYRYPTNVLWRFHIHHIYHNNKQVNILKQSTCNPIRSMATRHPRAYFPTSQK